MVPGCAVRSRPYDKQEAQVVYRLQVLRLRPRRAHARNVTKLGAEEGVRRDLRGRMLDYGRHRGRVRLACSAGGGPQRCRRDGRQGVRGRGTCDVDVAVDVGNKERKFRQSAETFFHTRAWTCAPRIERRSCDVGGGVQSLIVYGVDMAWTISGRAGLGIAENPCVLALSRHPELIHASRRASLSERRSHLSRYPRRELYYTTRYAR